MADELEYTTTNADGDSWVDVTPDAISTGYQAQNTTIEAAYNGLDNSYVYYDSGADEIVIPVSGPIDNNGVLVSVKSEVRLTVASDGDWYIRIVPGSSSTLFSLELTDDKGTWDASKNGLYDGDGYRVLNWHIHKNEYSSDTTVSKLSNNNLGSDTEPDYPSGFLRRIDVPKWLYYHIANDSFDWPSTRQPNDTAYDVSTGNLILTDSDDNLIYILDGISELILSSFAAPSSSISAIAYDTDTGNLISVDNGTDLVYVHSGVSASILTSFASPEDVVYAACYDRSLGNLILSGSSGDVYIMDGVSSSVLSTITPPSTSQGIDIDAKSGNMITFNASREVTIYSGVSSFVLVSNVPSIDGTSTFIASSNVTYADSIDKIILTYTSPASLFICGL